MTGVVPISGATASRRGRAVGGSPRPLGSGVAARYVEHDRLWRTRGVAAGVDPGFASREPSAGGLAQLNRPHRHHATHQILERAAHERHVVPSIHGARQRAQEIRERLSPVALARDSWFSP